MIDQIQATGGQLVVEVISTQSSATCPKCGCISEQIHSHYQRTVQDAPCAGQRVVLRLAVRKFFCRQPSCQRKIFTERLPDLVRPWARVSNRLLSEVKAIGLSASAEVSERLAPRLGMKVKAPTLLRHLRTIPDPPDDPVHVLGIDDFSMRRGDCYGTILVNMETHRPLELLPDRTADAVVPWLESHPEIDIVNRDRASAYADAVNRALPHATQVADRYHLVQNLREHVQKFLDHKHSLLPFVEDIPLKGAPTPSTSTLSPVGALPDDATNALVPDQHSGTIQEDSTREQGHREGEISSLTYAERQEKISRDKRYARYEEVMALYRAGVAQRAIARQLGVSRKLVAHFVSSPAFPERSPGSGQGSSGKSKLTRFIPYLRERWLAGIHKSPQLFQEIKEQGYTGSSSLLRHFLASWQADLPPKLERRKPRRLERQKPQKPRRATAPSQRRLSSRKASFLMILPPEKLTDVERKHIEQICLGSSELCTTYLLSQEFVIMLKNREAEALDGWLKRAKESRVSQLNSFVNGISRDYAAVRAAFSLSWSNGTTEGHVNRLKFLKRQMFGRAHLDLLRVKVLHAV